MTLTWPVVLAVLCGALLHAGWNALVKSSGDKPVDTALVHGLGAVLALPAALESPVAVAIGDGEPDAAQIVRGELPDANGDLVDDRRQSAFVLPDLDANGVADHSETGSDTELCAPTTLTYHLSFQGGGNPAPLREVWAAATRIREGGEVVDRVTWLAARPNVAAPYVFPPIPAVLHV